METGESRLRGWILGVLPGLSFHATSLGGRGRPRGVLSQGIKDSGEGGDRGQGIVVLGFNKVFQKMDIYKCPKIKYTILDPNGVFLKNRL